MALLTEPELGDLRRGFRRSARRFETRDRYKSDVGRESFRRFRAGEPDDYAWHRGWMRMIADDVAAGKQWRRVRIVSVPLSEWTRYGMEVARLSVQAGEDIRYLRRDDALRHGLTPLDSWIFDEKQLVHMHFRDGDDLFAGAELVDDETELRRHLAWWGEAWQRAKTIDDFVASLP